jgi:hypothetical protein
MGITQVRLADGFDRDAVLQGDRGNDGGILCSRVDVTARATVP